MRVLGGREGSAGEALVAIVIISPALPFTHPSGALIVGRPRVVPRWPRSISREVWAAPEESEQLSWEKRALEIQSPLCRGVVGRVGRAQGKSPAGKDPQLESQFPRSRAPRDTLLSVAAPGPRNVPETPTRSLPSKGWGQPGPHRDLGTIPGTPAPAAPPPAHSVNPSRLCQA